MAKMMLRAYNAEAENCVLTVKAGNGNVARNRLERARDQIVKLGALINLQINFHYHRLRIKELELTLQYQNAKKAEKEAEREERARLREQARWPGLVLWTGCFEGCWLLLVVLCPLARVLVG